MISFEFCTSAFVEIPPLEMTLFLCSHGSKFQPHGEKKTYEDKIPTAKQRIWKFVKYLSLNRMLID